MPDALQFELKHLLELDIVRIDHDVLILRPLAEGFAHSLNCLLIPKDNG